MATHTTHGLFPALLALGGNFVIFCFKVVAFLGSGSTAMFSEALHSLLDTTNQALLLFGIYRTRKKPTETYAYGFGKERFFWALISACGIFFLGSGVTIYHAIEALMHPVQVETSPFVWFVLIASAVIESITLWYAWSTLRARNHKASIKELLQEGDPVTLAVLYEDAVALIGVIVAAISILLSKITGNPLYDAAGSLVIGGLLAYVAVILIRLNHGYLLERSIDTDLRDEIIEHITNDPMVDRVVDFKSSVIDLDVFRIKCEIELNGTALMKEIDRNHFLKNEYEDVRAEYRGFLKFCVAYASLLPRIIGERINTIEASITAKFPNVKHIDIEIN